MCGQKSRFGDTLDDPWSSTQERNKYLNQNCIFQVLVLFVCFCKIRNTFDCTCSLQKHQKPGDVALQVLKISQLGRTVTRHQNPNSSAQIQKLEFTLSIGVNSVIKNTTESSISQHVNLFSSKSTHLHRLLYFKAYPIWRPTYI